MAHPASALAGDQSPISLRLTDFLGTLRVQIGDTSAEVDLTHVHIHEEHPIVIGTTADGQHVTLECLSHRDRFWLITDPDAASQRVRKAL